MPDLQTIIRNDLALSGKTKTLSQAAVGALLCGLYAALCALTSGRNPFLLVQAAFFFAVMFNFCTILVLAICMHSTGGQTDSANARRLSRRCEIALVLLVPLVAAVLAISQRSPAS